MNQRWVVVNDISLNSLTDGIGIVCLLSSVFSIFVVVHLLNSAFWSANVNSLESA